jgi:hypothetical protein
LVTALSVKVKVPAAETAAVGEKVTPTVQLAPAETAPQVLLATENGPLTPKLLTVSVVFRRFVRVIVRVELVETTTLPKLKLVGENVTGALPLPESVTFCVPELSVIVTLPEAVPTTVGANDTWIVHDALGAIGPLQLLVWLNGPVATTFVICSTPVPLLRRVMVFAVLVVPATCAAKDSDVGVIEAPGAVPVPVSITTCEEPRL